MSPDPIACPSLRASLSGLAFAAIVLGTPASAQERGAAAPAENAASAAARAETDEAMARARRLAANPMRVILEASRIRRRGGEDGTVVPVAAVGAGAAAVEAADAAATPRPPGGARPEGSALLVSSLAAPAAAVAPAPALVPPTAPAPAAPAALGLPALPALAPEIPRPTLVHRVNPEVPARVLAELPPDTVFVADLTIAPDGSVTAIEPVPPVSRALQRYVTAALQQWRFAPLPGERVWRVELQFRFE